MDVELSRLTMDASKRWLMETILSVIPLMIISALLLSVAAAFCRHNRPYATCTYSRYQETESSAKEDSVVIVRAKLNLDAVRAHLPGPKEIRMNTIIEELHGYLAEEFDRAPEDNFLEYCLTPIEIDAFESRQQENRWNQNWRNTFENGVWKACEYAKNWQPRTPYVYGGPQRDSGGRTDNSGEGRSSQASGNETVIADSVGQGALAIRRRARRDGENERALEEPSREFRGTAIIRSIWYRALGTTIPKVLQVLEGVLNLIRC